MRALRGLSLKESVSQFSHTMTAQADLRVEAAHLRRFYNNFSKIRHRVSPPFPFPGLVTEAVLIETFEPGGLHSLLGDGAMQRQCMDSRSVCQHCCPGDFEQKMWRPPSRQNQSAHG